MDENFNVSTSQAKYSASKQSEDTNYWIVAIKYNNGVEATYIFQNHTREAVAQLIFIIDKIKLP